MSIIEKDIELHRGAFAFLFTSTLDRLLFGMRPYWGQEQEPLHVTFVRATAESIPYAHCCSYFQGRGEPPQGKKRLSQLQYQSAGAAG